MAVGTAAGALSQPAGRREGATPQLARGHGLAGAHQTQRRRAFPPPAGPGAPPPSPSTSPAPAAVPAEAAAVAGGSVDEASLKKMWVVELKEVAKGLGLSGFSKLKKADLIALIVDSA